MRNKNGTYDYGIFQINSVWLPKIAAYGYTRHDLQYNACKNTEVAAWIIAKHMADGKEMWRSIANYHSGTPVHNQRYRDNVYTYYQKIANAITPNVG